MKAASTARARQKLERDYGNAIRDYLKKPDESSLELAYGLGRRALEQGLGVVEFAALYHEVLTRLLQSASSPAECSRTAPRLGHFFVESLSPFEMTHRGYRDAQKALHQLNLTLEAEAKRIAQALHDEAGQLLVTVHFALESLARNLTPNFEPQIEEVRRKLTEVEQELRRLSHELRPPMLDELGLVPALDFLAKGLAKRSGLHIAIQDCIPQRLSPIAEIALYRCAQEALKNVIKHAQATRVTVCVKQESRDGVAVSVCSVKDDGIGFKAPVASNGSAGGLGLLGMRERVHALGGWLDIKSPSSHGTELIINIPCPGN